MKRIFLFICMFLLMVCSCKKGKKITKIGIVNIVPVLEGAVDGFKEEMTALGYIEGQNVTYIYQGAAGGIFDIEGVVQDVIDKDADLIVSFGNQAAIACAKLTGGTELPVVLAISNRPVELGIVKSLTRPGANITGAHISGFTVKCFDWMIRTMPEVKYLFVPHNPDDQSSVNMLEKLQNEADQKDVTLVIGEARNKEEFNTAIANIPDHVDAVFSLSMELAIRNRHLLIEAAHDKKLPVISTTAKAVHDGALLSFGSDYVKAGTQAALVSDRIITGTLPEDIPLMDVPFFLGINLRVAREFDMEIPDITLNRADIIIR